MALKPIREVNALQPAMKRLWANRDQPALTRGSAEYGVLKGGESGPSTYLCWKKWYLFGTRGAGLVFILMAALCLMGVYKQLTR